MKKFLYLVQTKEGLSEHLQSLYGPQGDVIVLSWRRPVRDCIFFPFSTWTEGRNRLYQETLGKDYLYYIFLDGDAYLKTTELCKTPQNNPWRLFEEYLIEYEPAAGVPFYMWHKKSPLEVETLYSFDMILNAVHKEALPVLLPYYDGCDKISWWYSSVYKVHLASVLYPSHVLQFNALEVINLSSRHLDGESKGVLSAYPRSGDWTKPNNDFKAFILDEKFKIRFHPHPTGIKLANGEVRKKDKSYRYAIDELARLFDLNAPYWRRKIEITDKIAAHEPFACTGAQFTYFGEKTNRALGPIATWLIFFPLLFLRELEKLFRYAPRRFLRVLWNSTYFWRGFLGLQRNQFVEWAPLPQTLKKRLFTKR